MANGERFLHFILAAEFGDVHHALHVVVEGDNDLITKLMPEGYKARPDQVILFTVSAWDANCPQHIPQRFEAADVAAALSERDQRIHQLEAEVERLRTAKVTLEGPSYETSR